MGDSLVQILYRALATSGSAQTRRVKVRVHEALATGAEQVPNDDLTQVAQNIAKHYQGVERLRNDVEVIAMDLLPE